MRTLWISMGIGLVAGILDILPMIAQKLARRAILSAFLQYFFVSIIIVNINLPGLAWWLQGSLISLALAIPVLIIVTENDKKSLPIIASMSIVLGALISVAGHYIQ